MLLGKCKLFYDRKFKKIINKSIKNEFYIVLWILKFYNIFWRIFQYRLLKFGNWQRWEKDVETEKNKFKTRTVKNNRHILALKCRYTTVTVQSCELICLARVLATLDPIGIFWLVMTTNLPRMKPISVDVRRRLTVNTVFDTW